jgi:hypothetical protein
MLAARRCWLLALALTLGVVGLVLVWRLREDDGDLGEAGLCDGRQGGANGNGGRTGKNGIYCGQDMDNGYINKALVSLLTLFLRGQTVVDVGAGQGGYAEAMVAAGVSVRAFDGAAGIEAFTDGLVSRADLTQPLVLEPLPQWTLSFEVLEHIPPHLEPPFLANLALATEGVIMSCAIFGQGGTSHINTHPNDVVRDRLAELGFVFDPRGSAAVRWYLHHRVKDHFSTNLMVFFHAPKDDVS